MFLSGLIVFICLEVYFHLRLGYLLTIYVEPFSISFEHLFCRLTGALQANQEEELPEKLLGTIRLSNLEMQKAVLPPPESPIE